MSKIKFFVQQSWLLLVSSFFFGLLLAVTDAAWRPRILQNEQAEINKIMASLLPEAKTFEQAAETDIDLGAGRKTKSRIYKALSADGQCVGWEFNAEGAGFADKIKMIIAVDKNFEKITGIDFTDTKETPGFGDKITLPYYRDQFTQAPAALLKIVKTGDYKKIDSEIVAITGATVSSTAVVNAVNKYLKPVKDYLQTKGLIENVK
jgi:electron transport complex protein RnfG